MSADYKSLPVVDEGDILNERDLIDGQFAYVSVANFKGALQMFVSVTADVPDPGLLDGWFLPADAALLRGIGRDLKAAADALDRG